MLSHSFQRGFYVSRKHGKWSLDSVVSNVTERNLSNIEDEPADMCKHLVFSPNVYPTVYHELVEAYLNGVE